MLNKENLIGFWSMFRKNWLTYLGIVLLSTFISASFISAIGTIGFSTDPETEITCADGGEWGECWTKWELTGQPEIIIVSTPTLSPVGTPSPEPDRIMIMVRAGEDRVPLRIIDHYNLAGRPVFKIYGQRDTSIRIVAKLGKALWVYSPAITGNGGTRAWELVPGQIVDGVELWDGLFVLDRQAIFRLFDK